MPVSGFDPLVLTAPATPPAARDAGPVASDANTADKGQFNKLIDEINKTEKKPENDPAAEGAEAGKAAVEKPEEAKTQAAEPVVVPAPTPVPPPVVAPVAVAVAAEEAVVVPPVADAVVPPAVNAEGDVASALFGDGEMSLPALTLAGGVQTSEAQQDMASALAAVVEAEPQDQVQAQVQAPIAAAAAPKHKADTQAATDQAALDAQIAATAADAAAQAEGSAPQVKQAAAGAAKADAPAVIVQTQQAALAQSGTVPPVTSTAGLMAGVVVEEEAADAPAADAGNALVGEGDAPVNPLHVAASGEGEKLQAAPQPVRARPAEKERGDIGPADFSAPAAVSVNVAELAAETAVTKAADVTVVEIVHRSSAEATNAAQAGAERPTVRLMPVLEQVRIGLARAVDNGAPSKLSLELMPKNLGRVTIEVEATKDGQLKASIQAENPTALEVLRKDAPQLERSLQEAGYKMDHQSLSFSLRDHGQGGKGEGNGQGRGDRANPENILSPVVEDEAPVARRSRASMGRVDVTI
ncbi:flagellar hook-length control protein FliK [Lacibacterium aquatile]|uniref:Flagellar hook-length control protein FliK n=1 Tax=Lacibacterium aquatile TaxID=1168082 RepID=A0ABW5DTX2_9PROT